MPSTPSSSAEPDDTANVDRRPTSRRAIAGLALVSLLLPALILLLVLRGGDGDTGAGDQSSPTSDAWARNAARIGDPAPGFTLQSLDGDEVSLADYEGRPVLVTFWASWCVPCRKEFPVLREALAERPGEFEVVAIAYQDLERDSREFLEETGATWPSLVDPGGKVARAYGVTGIPQTFFVSADGVVRDRVFGVTSHDALIEPLDALLEG